MLDLHDQDAGEIRPRPLLVKLVSLFLLDLVIARDMEPLTIVRLQVRIRRLRAKVGKVAYEMIVKNCKRIMRLGVLVKSLRYQDDGAQKHRPAPELCQQLALDPDVANV